MKVGFICPDGGRIKFDDCFKACRLKERCIKSVTILRPMAWQPSIVPGKYSVTTLIAPTRISYLRRTTDYYIVPDSNAFSLLGTRVHKHIELGDHDRALQEEMFEDAETTGRADTYEEDGGKHILSDNKVWGSFSVAKAMGIVKGAKIPDPSGEVYKTSGKWGKAGSPKMVDTFCADPAQADNEDATWQLNRYRMFFQVAGFPVDLMYVNVIVRDGGCISALNRGVTLNLYSIPVGFLPDADVIAYFADKRIRLQDALMKNTVPPVCTEKERWNDLRCRKYCEVWQACDYGNSLKNNVAVATEEGF
jgi:hypothetical protein